MPINKKRKAEGAPSAEENITPKKVRMPGFNRGFILP
jgi:hypothetical protein